MLNVFVLLISAFILSAQISLGVWAEPVADFELESEPIQPLPEPEESPLIKAQQRLGQRLFHDVRLSGNNTISCARCHNLSAGGVDGLALSSGMKNQNTTRNTPTVFNASLNLVQFWDGRSKDLAEQLDVVIHSPFEMNSTWSSIEKKLSKDRAYVKHFNAAYDDGLTFSNIKHALLVFEKSLITTGSRFDRYLRGDTKAISMNELKGYQLFKSYGCVACHQGANVGGNLFQKMGVLKDYFDSYAMQNNDLGRFLVTGKEEDRHVFKVPSLRVAVLTAPYFHDGSVKTLHHAIEIMGYYQLGIHIPDHEVNLMIQFLHTLAGQYHE